MAGGAMFDVTDARGSEVNRSYNYSPLYLLKDEVDKVVVVVLIHA